MARTKRISSRVPPLGSLSGVFLEEGDALSDSDRRSLGRSGFESDAGATTNPPSSASSSLQSASDWEEVSPQPRRLESNFENTSDDSTAKQANNGPNEKILYDACTIRTWFMMMDQDGDGTISKDEFVAFLRERPALQKMLFAGSFSVRGQTEDADSDGERAPTQVSPKMAQAVLQRRMIKLFNEIDVNRNRSMEFEEFLEFFRRAGYLLEYTLTNNPRDRAAELLASAPKNRPCNMNSARRARRGSECCWAIEQQQKLLQPSDSPRRNSESAVLESPAALWPGQMILGSRTLGRSGRKPSVPRPETPESTFARHAEVSLVDLKNASPTPSGQSSGPLSRLWARRKSDEAKRVEAKDCMVS